MTIRKINGKYLEISLHILFGGLFILSPYLFRSQNTYKEISLWQYKLILNNCRLAFMFYLNTYLLYPRFYKRSILLYISLVILAVASSILLSVWIDKYFFSKAFIVSAQPKTEIFLNHYGSGRIGPDKSWFGWYFTSIISYIFVIGIGISYRIITDNARLEKIRNDKENEYLKTELSFLRSQISPHFIFNILNSMVFLARKKSDMLEPALIELSKLMRYMLYEDENEKVYADLISDQISCGKAIPKRSMANLTGVPINLCRFKQFCGYGVNVPINQITDWKDR